MTTYEVGQTITRSVKVTDAAGAPANVGGTVTCTVTLPDGTTTPATVGSPSPTGTYTATLASTQAGRHRFRWTATGTNSGGFPYTDVVDVWPTDPRLVIGLDDARGSLNLAASDTADDDELRLYIAAATDMLIDLADGLDMAILPTSRLEYHRPRADVLCLDHTPASVTSVTEYVGTTATLITQAANPGVAGESYTIDGALLVRRSNGYRKDWSGEVAVSYTWGPAVISPRVVLAARALVSHLWARDQRGNHGGAFGSPDVTITPRGYAIPNAVVQILDPTGEGRVSGIA